MPLFAPRECIEPDAPDPTGLRLSAGPTDTTAALRWFAGQTGRLFADPAAGLRLGGIKPRITVRRTLAASNHGSRLPAMSRRELQVDAGQYTPPGAPHAHQKRKAPPSQRGSASLRVVSLAGV